MYIRRPGRSEPSPHPLMRRLAALMLLLTAGCSTLESVPATEASPASTASGYVLGAGAGELLRYCDRPVDLELTVDSLRAPTTRLVAGTAVLRGDEGLGLHRGSDEVIYILRGSGYAAFGADTLRLEPGAVLFVPENTQHRVVSTGTEPMEFLMVIGPRSSAEGFRRAAARGCDAPAPAPPVVPGGGRPHLIEPGAGEVLEYCELPLTFTLKVNEEVVSGSRLRLAHGALRRGSEYGSHRGADEVAYIVSGRGRAIVGADTVPVAPGATIFVPEGTPHGFINDAEAPLEYLVVHGPAANVDAFRRRASLPGPHCRSERGNDGMGSPALSK